MRTALQHLWAELSEKLADIFGQEVKYGGGEVEIKNSLESVSANINRLENIETKIEARHRLQSKVNIARLDKLENLLTRKKLELSSLMGITKIIFEKIERR